MKLTSKKEMNGTKVAIFDTQGASIEDIVTYLSLNGWQFAKLTVTYTAKGKPKKVDVPPAKVKAVQAKYNFDKWSFAARKGNMVIVCQMSDHNKRAIVSKASNGAAKVFLSIPAHATPAEPETVAPADALTSQQQELLRRKQEIASQEAADAASLRAERDRAAQEAAAALYAPQEDVNEIPEMTEVERGEKRHAARAAEQARIAEVSSKKHTGLLIWAIIECLLLVPIAFGGFAILDIVQGRKLLRDMPPDPEEAETRFKNARQLLIFGIIFGIVITAVACWKFLPVIL